MSAHPLGVTDGSKPIPQIAIVAGSDLSRHILKKLLLEAGCDARCVEPAHWRDCQQSEDERPDAWLFDASDAQVEDLLADIIEHCDAPFLISDEIAPQQPAAFAEWRRRMLAKLEELAATASGARVEPVSPPQAVWVLAASTGGPEAVSEFLAALAPNLPLAFVYAQHIEPRFDTILANALERHRHYRSVLSRGDQSLEQGQILVVPADRQLRFLPFHRVLETRKRWEGRYQPAIDQVVGNIARLYPQRAGVIVFSGTCDDGALGCRVMQACGGEIWVQTPASCVSPDMPNAALATGIVSKQGTPAQLAQALSSRYSQSHNGAATPGGASMKSGETTSE